MGFSGLGGDITQNVPPNRVLLCIGLQIADVQPHRIPSLSKVFVECRIADQ